jgi:hypothetical protein
MMMNSDRNIALVLVQKLQDVGVLLDSYTSFGFRADRLESK